MEGMTSTRENFGNIMFDIYTWEGLSAKDSYENYLIHVYSPEYYRIKKDTEARLQEKEKMRRELGELYYDGKRNTKWKKGKIAHLEYEIKNHPELSVKDMTYMLNMERNVNRAISVGLKFNKKTKLFDSPENDKQRRRDNTEYELERFIDKHIHRVEYRKRIADEKKKEPKCSLCEKILIRDEEGVMLDVRHYATPFQSDNYCKPCWLIYIN